MQFYKLILIELIFIESKTQCRSNRILSLLFISLPYDCMSLIVFYFLGVNMTALISKNLAPQFKWTKWRGTFAEVHDYLIDAFYKALKEFRINLADTELASELSNIVEYCCFPIPDRRGHPRAIRLSKNRDGSRNINISQFDFRRIISKFDSFRESD